MSMTYAKPTEVARSACLLTTAQRAIFQTSAFCRNDINGVGLIVVWFLPVAQTDPNIKSLSIFAVALLVGYSIDLLFALMDRIIAAFTTQGERVNARGVSRFSCKRTVGKFIRPKFNNGKDMVLYGGKIILPGTFPCPK